MCKGSEERTRTAGLRPKRAVWWELGEREHNWQDPRAERLAEASSRSFFVDPAYLDFVPRRKGNDML